ncbi:MAG: SAM-dependent methyltransferase [Actinomycetota bacterium]|nr:SAM-dependent methyltransferase [Actinomycetota bacterium]
MEQGEPPSFDTSRAHPARVYDYWLGGKDNYEADRAAAREVIAAMPGIVPTAQANRAFLRRAVQYLAGEAGIRQFLDIGTGLPTAQNTHEVAQETAPASRIVYVDNDPIVLAHARALLTSAPEGATTYLQADARDPGKILAEAARALDFSQPVAVMMLAVLQFIPDSDGPHDIVSRLMEAVPAGSYLAMSHATLDFDPGGSPGADRYNARVAVPLTPRTRAQIARFFDGLDLAEPGLVPLPHWRALASPRQQVSLYAAVGRKP